MSAYQRDDGDGPVEMVEIGPHRTMRREAAIAMGLWSPPTPIGAKHAAQAEAEFRETSAKAALPSEVVGGFEGDCSATRHAETTLPGPDRVSKPAVDAQTPGKACPRRSAGQPPRLKERDSRKDGAPAEVAPAPPPVSAPSAARRRPPKAKRSLKEILADCGR